MIDVAPAVPEARHETPAGRPGSVRQGCLRAAVATGMLAAVLFLPLALAAPPAASPPAPAQMAGAATASYAAADGKPLSLFLFAPAPPARSVNLLLFNGSGWIGGDVRQFAGWARALQGRGYGVVLAEYRTLNPRGATPMDGIDDAFRAWSAARRLAAAAGYAADCWLAGGASSGGHLALALGLFRARFPQVPPAPPPDGYVLFAPVLDTTEAGYPAGVPLFEGEAAAWSPAGHLHTLPPVLLLQGGDDRWVKPESALRFAARALAQGTRVDLHLYSGRGHVFFDHPGFRPANHPDTFNRLVEVVAGFLDTQPCQE